MVHDFITNLKPDLIINCAAYTAVDRAGSELVHISTDYVFGGDLDLSQAYKEDDEKKPITAYGITKKTKFIQEICIVGTNYLKNFFQKQKLTISAFLHFSINDIDNSTKR